MIGSGQSTDMTLWDEPTAVSDFSALWFEKALQHSSFFITPRAGSRNEYFAFEVKEKNFYFMWIHQIIGLEYQS